MIGKTFKTRSISWDRMTTYKIIEEYPTAKGSYMCYEVDDMGETTGDWRIFPLSEIVKLVDND